MNTATASPIGLPTLQPYKADPAKTIWQAKPLPEVEPLRPLYLSPSSVKSYLACPLNYYYDRVVGLREKTSVALHIGKAIHATLQAFNNARWRGTDSSEEAMQEAFSRHFLRLEQEEGPLTTQMRKRALKPGKPPGTRCVRTSLRRRQLATAVHL